MKLAQQPVINIRISLPDDADRENYGFLEKLLGNFVMLGNGMLVRGHDNRLKTAYADIGMPRKNNVYHVHYARGSVGYLKKHGSKWFVEEDFNIFRFFPEEVKPFFIEQQYIS